jgi:hypothetical protein
MRGAGLLLAGGLVAAGGCTLAIDAGRNIVHEEAICAGGVKARLQARLEADQAWYRAREATPFVVYSDAYGDGFRDGYVDFAVNGGRCSPPALPPPCYRTQSSDSAKLAADWFAGFRHGADAARADDAHARRLVPVVVAVGPNTAATHPTAPSPAVAEPPLAKPAEQRPAPGPVLPMPRPVNGPELPPAREEPPVNTDPEPTTRAVRYQPGR